MRDVRWIRLGRGAAAATVATAVALSGHLLGGGAMPTLIGIALPWWLAVSVAVIGVGRGPSLGRVVAVIGASQILFHLLFRIGLPASGPGRLVDPPGAHLHHGGGPTPAGAFVERMPLADAALAHHAAHHGLTGPMLAGHVLAVIVTALLLHRGELLVRRALGVAVAALRVITSVAGPQLAVPVLELPRRAGDELLAPMPGRMLAVLRRALGRRGPPAHSCI